MGARGPRPKPSALKRLAGNPGRRRLSEDEPQPRPAVPRCPSHLDAEARREWRRVARQLADLGVLAEVDRAVLVAYCRAWSLYVEADRAVQAHGTVITNDRGVPYLSPYLHQMTGALKQLKTYAAELGMTPSSRSRVTKTKTQRSDDAQGEKKPPKLKVV